MKYNNLIDWLNEAEGETVHDPIYNPNQVPVTNKLPEPVAGNEMPNQEQEPLPQDQGQGQPATNANSEPVAPDMPEQKQPQDFEVWKNKYIKESIKGSSDKLIDLLLEVRDKDNLSPYQRKFVEDNWNIQAIRLHSNVDKASKEIRKNIKESLDRNNPATSLVNHMSAVLETIPLLNSVFIKLNGYGALKGDLHRKFIAALFGCVQVGSGANNEDLIYSERDYSILISTKMNSRFGEVVLGSWSLLVDDSQRYLDDAELKKMRSGSPMERSALQKRVIIESIAALFETRAFVINVVDEDGTIYALGWDISNSLRGGFTSGKLVVKTKKAENNEALISDDGKIIPLMDIGIYYTEETSGEDDEGKKVVKETPFIERRNGNLVLVADLQLIKKSSTALQGMVLKSVPFRGNPSDKKRLTSCVYGTSELILRIC